MPLENNFNKNPGNINADLTFTNVHAKPVYHQKPKYVNPSSFNSEGFVIELGHRVKPIMISRGKSGDKIRVIAITVYTVLQAN